MRDWDDLRYFLAVARAGSLSGAAKALGVNHSTVFRRIETLEDRLGVRLFDRHREGYALTPAGDEMREAAERVDTAIDDMDRRIGGRDLRLSGPLGVTTTDNLVPCVLGEPLAGFHAAYPGIELSVRIDSEFFNLSKRQADIAVRPTNTPPDTLVGRRIAELAFAVYAAEGVKPDNTSSASLSALPWVAFDDTLDHLAAAKWFNATHGGAPVAMRSNNLTTLQTGAAQGMGLALLPCFMGDPDARLERVTDPVPAARSELWLLTHEDLRNTRRVRAFMDFMADALEARRDVLEGRG